jgi:hypothetical protein
MGMATRIFKGSLRIPAMHRPHGPNEETIQLPVEVLGHHHTLDMGMEPSDFNSGNNIPAIRIPHSWFW